MRTPFDQDAHGWVIWSKVSSARPEGLARCTGAEAQCVDAAIGDYSLSRTIMADARPSRPGATLLPDSSHSTVSISGAS
ncbi:hypothetical protein GCM10011519_32710 [Marmoricola endophyticus]|uniref:Uncharacterized protein n=1 Tax=Marmoricola endophyticus TaxID=2040280 RepID=A0A917BRP6_9ACTN|nr:hypothetical protein GCM10011519_32710 [Marmoricola endophyticus]